MSYIGNSLCLIAQLSLKSCIGTRGAEIYPKAKPEPRPAPHGICWAQHRALPGSFKRRTKPGSQCTTHCDRLPWAQHKPGACGPGSAKSPAGPELWARPGPWAGLCISNRYLIFPILTSSKSASFILILFLKKTRCHPWSLYQSENPSNWSGLRGKLATSRQIPQLERAGPSTQS